MTALFLAADLIFGITGKTAEVSYAPGVEAGMYEPEYWVSRCEDAEEILLDRDEIQKLNRTIQEEREGLVNQIWNREKYFNGTERKVVWASRSFPEVPLYRDGNQLTAADLGKYLSNILEAETTEHQPLQYGICTETADIKMWPERAVVSKDKADPYYDEFQISTAAVNTPALLDGKTADGCFVHVVLYDCEGWTAAENFAVCQDKEKWMEAQEMENCLIVTEPRIYVGTSRRLLTMGTRLRLAEETRTGREIERVQETEKNGICGMRSGWGCYVAELPCRRKDGTYEIIREGIPAGAGVSKGFLTYNRKNILELSLQFLGEPYGWGGMYDSVDCSGLVQAVFACFGIRMPRNSKTQMEVVPEQLCFADASNRTERRNLLDTLDPGALLYFPGHIMIYLGKQNREYYVISAAGSAMLPEETAAVEPIRSVIINTLSMKRKNGVSWEAEITLAGDVRLCAK